MDYEALIDLLNSNYLSGAILDVFDPEPLPADSRLWRTRNLLVTPHVSADDGNAYVLLTLKVFFENMDRLIRGVPLKNQVNAGLGY